MLKIITSLSVITCYYLKINLHGYDNFTLPSTPRINMMASLSMITSYYLKINSHGYDNFTLPSTARINMMAMFIVGGIK